MRPVTTPRFVTAVACTLGAFAVGGVVVSTVTRPAVADDKMMSGDKDMMMKDQMMKMKDMMKDQSSMMMAHEDMMKMMAMDKMAADMAKDPEFKKMHGEMMNSDTMKNMPMDEQAMMKAKDAVMSDPMAMKMVMTRAMMMDINGGKGMDSMSGKMMKQ